ncbi:CPBP family glutamic-type intramembrane protease [Pedobacter cryoconitis]|uniref:CPBP family glutamic-type intramembrane protease n=1 Tax=Pedobacter cryoconitis TaxID=188932 RepID=UPI00147427EE|nr:CPBP family glutamic-type intramembrane protease [Pedobacter cryoconitis]
MLNKVVGSLVLLIFNWLALIVFGVFISTLFIEAGVMTAPVMEAKIFPNPGMALLLAGLFAPLIEELMFRIWLVYSRTNLSIAIGTILAALSYKLYFYSGLADGSQYIKVGVLTILIGVVMGCFSFIGLKKIDLNLMRVFKSNSRKLTIISSFIFGYLHLTNYKITPNLLLFSPIVLANYIIGGLILSFIRVRYGLIYAVLFHAVYNSIFILIKFR